MFSKGCSTTEIGFAVTLAISAISDQMYSIAFHHSFNKGGGEIKNRSGLASGSCLA